MTKFCVEDILIEELKEQGLNVTDLFQAHVKNNRKQTKIVKITYYIDNETQEKLIEAGIDDMEELLAALEKCLDGCDIIIEKKIKQC
ncbi:hypothetical protein LCGC14_1982670 [marine sediment metagenome]|uniref:Uncharacterized protein n=1 Tax=marine sediment metagenome TaxID=412755 RepID=A0A0F9F8C2_9ZZZZ